ncbi:DUF2164 domain-containing protein [Paenibacillus azoreducens]|uniref:DUF2164 domain-containing protein n=1 Tax=Paenibacillus azoreducens TaxID=116718 RepID=A0A919YHI3_9BACL|nr:DUF2164 domain-containing protein [Paenibacillus azoreducens]GIO50746.1 hypothetical protein J34TS1_55110 [Paenibacillus azoreducens]
MYMSIKLSREQKAEIAQHVQAFFEEERSESIGQLGAEQLIDFMITELGPHIYNQAVADARALITEKMAQIDDELYTLEKPVQHPRR